MEARIQKLEETVIQLFQTLVGRAEASESRIAELESLLSTGVVDVTSSDNEPKKRKQTKYSTYMAIKALVATGKTEKEIAMELEEPYTTVRAYLKWTPEHAEKKRIEEEKQNAKKAKRMKRDTASIPPITNNYTDVSNTVVSASPIRDNITDAIITNTTPHMVEGYIVECPISPGEYGEAGWYEWTSELKDFAYKHKDSYGFPKYPPVGPLTQVKVQYMNETFSEPMVARDVDWVDGVMRWKAL